MRTPQSEDWDKASQAERIIARFGGPIELAAAIQYSLPAIYKWNHPRSKHGCHGLIPTRALERIITVARMFGVLLTEDDLKPRTIQP